MTVLDRFRLDGRTALITGGSRGLGFAIARALAEAGADVIVVGRDESTLNLARRQLSETGRRIEAIKGDLATPEGAERLCDRVLALGVPIEVLVNNVGGRRLDVTTETVPTGDWQAFFNLNLTSALVCCQRIGQPMLARGQGSIVNVTSIAGPIAIKGIGGRHYEASKAALTSLTKSLAADWAGRGVRVNAMRRAFSKRLPTGPGSKKKPEFRQSFLDHIPMNRLGQPDEIGPAAVFLASDASQYMTGSVLVVDGGFTCW